MSGACVLACRHGGWGKSGKLAASICIYVRTPTARHAIRHFCAAKHPAKSASPCANNSNNPNNPNNPNSGANNSNSGANNSSAERKIKEDFVRPSPPSLGKDMFGLKRMLTAVEFDAKGHTTDRSFSNHQITSEMNIQLRDLRNIDHAYPPQKASILVRDRAIIVHIQPVRAVIQWNRMLLFTAGHDAVYTNLSPSLREYLFLQGAPGSHALPFEFCALEALLIYVCEAFERRVADLAPCIEAEIKKQQTNPETEPLTMYQHKKNLAHCETDIHEVKSALAELLQNDEDMAAMYLSIKAATGYPRRKNQHEEIETLLENYLRQIEQMEGAIRDLRESITVTEEYVNLQLDSARNRMMRHTLGLSVGTMASSLGGIVIGAFGMNLTTGLETHPWAFWAVAAFVPATMVGIFYGIRMCLGLRTTKTLPNALALGKRVNFVMLPAAELLSVQQRQQAYAMLQMRMREQEEAMRAQDGTQADIAGDMRRIKEQQEEMEKQHKMEEQQKQRTERDYKEKDRGYKEREQKQIQQMQQQQNMQQNIQQNIQQQLQMQQQQLDKIKLMEQVRQKPIPFTPSHSSSHASHSSHAGSHSHHPPKDIQQLDQELAERIKEREIMKKRGEPPYHWDAQEEPVKEQMKS